MLAAVVSARHVSTVVRMLVVMVVVVEVFSSRCTHGVDAGRVDRVSVVSVSSRCHRFGGSDGAVFYGVVFVAYRKL